MDKKLKGIAMILFGILIAQNPATNAVLPYIMGVVFGLWGLLIALSTKE
jgi:uncharacterized membrane protein HdeD (DUF308 family)